MPETTGTAQPAGRDLPATAAPLQAAGADLPAEAASHQAAGTQKSSGRDLPSKNFYYALFAVAIAGLLAIMAANVVIDPRGVFGTGLLQPLAKSQRTEKLNLIDSLASPPQIVIFGPSTATKINPALVENLTGETCFNSGVGAGSTEDFYAQLAYMVQDRKSVPKTAWLDLDLFVFSDYTGFSEELVSEDRLYSKVGGFAPFNFVDRYSRTVRPSYIADDLTVINYTLFGYPPIASHFDSLGYIHYNIMDAQKQNGTFNLSSTIAASGTRNTCEIRYATMNQLSAQRKQFFGMFLALANQNNISVVVFTMPYYHDCNSIMDAQPNYIRLRNDEAQFLAQRWGHRLMRSGGDLQTS